VINPDVFSINIKECRKKTRRYSEKVGKRFNKAVPDDADAEETGKNKEKTIFPVLTP
jgi:hypothetical protein